MNVWAHIMRQIKLFVTNQIYDNRRLNIMAVSIRQTISVRGGDCSSHPLSTMIGNNLPWCRCCSCSIVSVASRRCIVCARSPSIECCSHVTINFDCGHIWQTGIANHNLVKLYWNRGELAPKSKPVSGNRLFGLSCVWCFYCTWHWNRTEGNRGVRTNHTVERSEMEENQSKKKNGKNLYTKMINWMAVVRWLRSTRLPMSKHAYHSACECT